MIQKYRVRQIGALSKPNTEDARCTLAIEEKVQKYATVLAPQFMTSENDQPDEDLHSEKSELQFEFAAALNAELDAVGFPASPKRTGALADAVGFGRTQAYRALKGHSTPTVPLLLGLHKAGVSIDRILKAMSSQESDVVRMRVGDAVVNTVFQRSISNISSVVAVPDEKGVFDLQTIASGGSVSQNAIPLTAVHFPQSKFLAIVDDDPNALQLMAKQMGVHFMVVAFSNATEFLAYPAGPQAFDLFLIDWLLPDMDGEKLVHTVRKCSDAPIFILTGATSSVESLARAMDLPNVRHIGKPVHEAILLKHLRLVAD